MNDKERYNIAEMLDTLTIEQKKNFLSFLQALQAQEQQHSANTNTAPGTDRAEQSSQAQHDTSTTQASHSTTEDTAPSADHDSTEASSPSTNAAHKPAEQAPDTNGKSATHRPSTQPRTLEEAAERIQYISLDEAMTDTANAYRAAILQWVDDNEPETPAQYMTFALAYAAGLQEGKRQERQRRHERREIKMET